MTFEEFFKKKRIDLAALQAGEPSLFSEFKKHYELMGEKSFDHTKKYWFNKLRLLYHLAPELKPEKMHLENQLAEQTIVETLTEAIPVPSVGFKPRFKAGMASKPAESTSDQKKPSPESSATLTPEVNEAAEKKEQSPAFQQEKETMQNLADITPRTTEEAEAKAESETAKKPGFKPRFNMKMAAAKPAATEQPQTLADLPTPLPTTEDANEKPAYKPRFSMKTVAKPAETEEKNKEAAPPLENSETTPPPVEPAAPKPGFKPRFNMKMVAPKPAEAPVADENESFVQAKAHEPEKAEPEDKETAAPPAENAEEKPAYKPRFNMKNIKPKPPEE